MTMTRLHVLAALAAAGAAAGLPGAVRAAEIKLTVGSSPEDDIAPVLYAQSAGVFKKLGLDVDVQQMASGAAAAAAVAGGSLQFAKSSLLGLISAHARNVPLVLVAPGSYTSNDNPIGELVVAKNSPYKTVKDLDGKTLAAASLKDVKAITASEWIDQHGGNSKTVKFVEVPNSTIVPALEENRIAAAVVLNPVLFDGLTSGRVRSLGPAFNAIAPHWLVTAWFTTRDYLAKNPELTRKFVQGVREGSQYVNAHPKEVAPQLAAFLKQDVAREAAMKRSPLDLDLNPKEIQPVIDVAVKYGVIDKGFRAEEMIATLAPGK